jgi:hypothetical protein
VGEFGLIIEAQAGAKFKGFGAHFLGRFKPQKITEKNKGKRRRGPDRFLVVFGFFRVR